MKNNDFHKDFKINDLSFSDVFSLLKWVKKTMPASYCFLADWFNTRDFIDVKTSGSTGIPKVIKLKKEHMTNSARATGNYFKVREHTTALVCLSSEYIAGKMMLVRALTLGWNIDIIGAVSNPLSQTLRDYDFAAMVPIQLRNSLSEIHRIKKLIVGGGMVDEVLIQEIQQVKTQVFATYGMTETITHIAVKKLNPSQGVASKKASWFLGKVKTNSTSGRVKMPKEKSKSFYQVLPNVGIAIDHRNCLVIEAPKVSDDIIVTNDVVQLISENEFDWLGRFDNVINSGGIKLHPEKIEEKLVGVMSHRFFVAGLKDTVLGERLVLVIESKKFDVQLERAGLSKYEMPKQIYFLDHFIETSTKKIQRKKTLDLLKL